VQLQEIPIALIGFSTMAAMVGAPAQAVVIGFESLTQPNATYNFVSTEPYREGEFQIDRPAGNGQYPLATCRGRFMELIQA
jgi:hypothetical protein